MLSEEQLQQFDNFCARFKETDIDGYSDGGYENGLGNTDPDLDFSDWDKTQDLREEFSAWIEELFHYKNVDCNFSSSHLEVYEKVFDNKIINLNNCWIKKL